MKKALYISRIKKLLDSKNLELISEIHRSPYPGDSHFRAIGENYKKEKFLFKAAFDPANIEIIKKEIHFANYLRRHPTVKTQTVIDSQINSQFIWAIFSYIEGEETGYMFQMKRQVQNPDFAISFANNFLNLQKIDHRDLRRIALGQGSDEFDLMLRKKEIIGKILDNRVFGRILSLIKEKKSFFQNNPLVLAHGDSSLVNHIIGSDGKIYLIDWGKLHLNSAVHDIALLWIDAWRYPSWRYRLLSYFLAHKSEQTKLKELFRLKIIILSCLELYYWNYWQIKDAGFYHRSGYNPRLFGQTKRALRKHLQTIKVTLESPSLIFQGAF